MVFGRVPASSAHAPRFWVWLRNTPVSVPGEERQDVRPGDRDDLEGADVGPGRLRGEGARDVGEGRPGVDRVEHLRAVRDVRVGPLLGVEDDVLGDAVRPARQGRRGPEAGRAQQELTARVADPQDALVVGAARPAAVGDRAGRAAAAQGVEDDRQVVERVGGFVDPARGDDEPRRVDLVDEQRRV